MLKNINLVNPGDSVLGYTHSKFPDGQQGITLNLPIRTHHSEDTYEIISRLNNFMDVEKIICARAALTNIGAKVISLKVPYFLGARSDRKFGPGSYHYLKEVIAPIINDQGFEKVFVRDAHSDVLEGCIDNFEAIDNDMFIDWALKDIGYFENPLEFIPISPDAGAYKKVDNTALRVKHLGSLLTAHKHRDIDSGQITRTSIPELSTIKGGTYIIIDDIIDGGRTFIEIANIILEHDPDAIIYLIVTHGIFSAGYAQLAKRFKCVYTTNSYQEFNKEGGFIKSFNTYLR